MSAGAITAPTSASNTNPLVTNLASMGITGAPSTATGSQFLSGINQPNPQPPKNPQPKSWQPQGDAGSSIQQLMAMIGYK
jgi:hypothetical protein